MYDIRDEYGSLVTWCSESYDRACRVAHFMRNFGNCDYFVVCRHTGRAVSEVVDDSIPARVAVRLDREAITIAKRLLK